MIKNIPYNKKKKKRNLKLIIIKFKKLIYWHNTNVISKYIYNYCDY